MKKNIIGFIILIFISVFSSGCVLLPAAAIGGAGAGGYFLGKSDKSAKAIFTDAKITASVKNELYMAEGVRGSKIDVDTSNGIVVLTGRVSTDVERELALKIARAVKGVKAVKDGLAVIP